MIQPRCFLVGAFASVSLLTANAADIPNAGWKDVPQILKQIVPPKFPSREFNITDFGAVGNGTNLCTTAFERAIDACHQAGGGRVIVPAGTFLTGAIHLKDNVNLHLDRHAIIKFSTNTADYMPPVFTRYEGTEVMNFSPFIYAFEQTNIAVTGSGTLDGQASDTVWHNWKSYSDPKQTVEIASRGVPVSQRIFGEGHHLRPNFVEPVRCKNVLIQGILLTNSPMWVLSPVYCTNVIVRGVTVDTKGPNTDGCDPDSCYDVLIENDSFSDGDDCIAIKSGRDRDGQQINIPCENLVIRNCKFQAGHGGIAIGSETSGGVRNVFAENCQFNSTNLEMAMRFKTNPARGGYIENAFIRNCSVKTAQVGIHMTLRYGSSGAIEGNSVPIIRDITIRNCTFKKLTKQPIFIEGWSPQHEITDINILNCHFLKAAKPSVITNVTRINLAGTTGN